MQIKFKQMFLKCSHTSGRYYFFWQRIPYWYNTIAKEVFKRIMFWLIFWS